jgi:hypothetical protein
VPWFVEPNMHVSVVLVVMSGFDLARTKHVSVVFDKIC